MFCLMFLGMENSIRYSSPFLLIVINTLITILFFSVAILVLCLCQYFGKL